MWVNDMGLIYSAKSYFFMTLYCKKTNRRSNNPQESPNTQVWAKRFNKDLSKSFQHHSPFYYETQAPKDYERKL